jgi:hypothetical protein
MRFHDFAYTWYFANVERREKLGFFSGKNQENTVGLRLTGGNFRDQTRTADSYRAVQTRFDFHLLMEIVRGFERRPVQAFSSAHIEVGFVDGSHFHLRRESSKNTVDLFRTFAVALGMPVDEDGVRALLRGRAKWHGGVDPEFSRFVRSGRDNAALMALTSHDHGLPFQRWIVEFLDRDEESIHVDVEDRSRKRGLTSDSHAAGILAVVGGELVPSILRRPPRTLLECAG